MYQQKIVVWSAGDKASHGIDSGGFSVSRYEDWYNAKYGDVSVKLFAKLHNCMARYAIS